MLAFASVLVPLLLGLIISTWRVGTKIGGMSQDIKGQDKRIERLEKHEDDHDHWHLERGDK